MDDENGLKQVTTRLPYKDIETIENLAKSDGVSASEIIRCLVKNNLRKHFSTIQYADREQGEVIKKLLEKFFTEISGIRTELRRIGVNYNQEVRLQNLGKQFRTGEISMSETLKMHQYITEECKGFSPEAINEIMDRFDSIVEEFVNVMAYTRISHTRNGRAAIQYARGNGRGHNGHAKRNLLIGGVGMLPDEVIPFEEQMAQDWARASGKNKNQVRRIVASYSEKELDPHGEDSAYLALEIAQEFVEEAYPNRKAAIFVQNDGKGEKLHVHILVSNVDSIPAHMESADRKYRARSYTLGDAYGVEALREKLDEKAKEQLRMAEQRSHATESSDLTGISQGGFNMETAAYLPMNKTPEMKCVPEVKQKSVRMVADTINAIVSGLYREAGAETPIPAQLAPTTPPTAAEGDGRANSTPEGKQPVQSATAPREYEGAFAKLQEVLRKENEQEAKRQLENQTGMDWLPY